MKCQLFNLVVRNWYKISTKCIAHHHSSVIVTDEKPIFIVEVVCVFAQREVSSDVVETSSNDVHFPVSETDSHMQPVDALESLNLTR